MSKMTPWFPGSVKPARKGVYERKAYGRSYSRWNGKAWMFSAHSPKDTKGIFGRETSMQQCSNWRGLAEKP